MCHCGNTGMERTSNKSEHIKLTLEKKILPAAPAGIRTLATFRSRVRRSNQQAIPVVNVPSLQTYVPSFPFPPVPPQHPNPRPWLPRSQEPFFLSAAFFSGCRQQRLSGPWNGETVLVTYLKLVSLSYECITIGFSIILKLFGRAGLY